HDATLEGADEVRLAVADEHLVAGDDRRAVDGAGADEQAPDLLAGADLERVDAAVAAAADQEPLAADHRDDRDRVVRVFRLEAGGRPPDGLAGLLVERDEAAAAHALVAPAGVEHADDDQILIDDGAGDAAAVAGDAAVLLGQRVLPDDVEVLVEAEEEALD